MLANESLVVDVAIVDEAVDGLEVGCSDWGQDEEDAVDGNQQEWEVIHLGLAFVREELDFDVLEAVAESRELEFQFRTTLVLVLAHRNRNQLLQRLQQVVQAVVD